MSDQPPSDVHVASINRLKLAVATAVIRCKASHVTAKEYAQSLGQSLRKNESDWKDQARKLEAELLRTRQELATARLREARQDQEQDDMEWDMDEKESNQGNVALQSSAACPDFAFPTPPSSIPNEQPSQNNLENHLRSSTQFLHSMIRLKSLPESTEYDSLPVDALRTVKDSALRALEYLGSYASSHLHDDGLPWKLMNDAVRGVVKTLEHCTEEEIRREIVQGALELVEKLLELMLHNKRLNDHLTQRQLCCLVVSLATSTILAPLILQRILPHIQAAAAMLRCSINTTSFDPTLYENSFFLLSMMEDILLLSRTAPSVHNRGDHMKRALMEVGEGLDSCLLHISEDFPLFSQQIWRVVNILEWIISTKTEG
ncbi:meiosis-specific protein MEI4-like [Patiria miniata]|uniref:Uncharacterized protein n=1 Tax=Patiria miniata TaxID=46514 RepID=A0A914A738_PATMI|nr:meiosis-specific protein MEI4-like [Patiria miniata]XP_038059681.1 meiosis-specific protein MEI4-like [Patiria miniata]XP_038059682.1 meiosis-specific protein MEI4-like [Patiria miniata]